MRNAPAIPELGDEERRSWVPAFRASANQTLTLGPATGPVNWSFVAYNFNNGGAITADGDFLMHATRIGRITP